MLMAKDARFEETTAGDRPLKLRAEGDEDLRVVSALLQDAVGVTGEIAWAPRRRRLVLLLNRFRWEDRPAAERDGRPFERVRAALALEDVTRVRARGLDPNDKETVFSVLALGFDRSEDGAGTVRLMLAGDGEIAAEVECLNLALADVTQPWAASAGRAPDHGA